MQRVIGHIRDINSIGDEKISIFFLFDRLGGLAPSVCDGFFYLRMLVYMHLIERNNLILRES